MWIELHVSAARHPKINRLARDLGITRVQARGHLVTMWLWTLDMAPDGDLASFDEADIEEGAEWVGDEGVFVAACVVRGLLDEGPYGLVVHDWVDYAGNLKVAEQRRQARERKRKERGLKKEFLRGHSDVTSGHSDVTSSSTGPHSVTPDRPDQTDQTERPDQTDPGGDAARQDWMDVARVEEEGSHRWGELEGEALRIVLDLVPVHPSHWRAALGQADKAQARKWLWVAKALKDVCSQPLPPEPTYVDQKPAEEPEFAAMPPEGMLAKLVGKMGM